MVATVTEKCLKRVVDRFCTRSNEDVWVSKGNGGCEVIATVLCITLPVYKLVLLCLKSEYRTVISMCMIHHMLQIT